MSVRVKYIGQSILRLAMWSIFRRGADRGHPPFGTDCSAGQDESVGKEMGGGRCEKSGGGNREKGVGGVFLRAAGQTTAAQRIPMGEGKKELGAF